MGMTSAPTINTLENNARVWENEFGKFFATVYVPANDLPDDIINYGFRIPYLLIFTEHHVTAREAADFAEANGFASIAKAHAGSVVFVYPNCEGGWKNADVSLYQDLIANSKLNQYYADGMATPINRFTGEAGEKYIRGAIFRVYLYGYGESADYIARCCLTTVQGEYLWGPGEITPAVCTLEGLSTAPSPEGFRRDIPIISVANSEEINKFFIDNSDNLLIHDKADNEKDFYGFVRNYRRWCGNLEIEPDLDKLDMVCEPVIEELTMSPDNLGDDSPVHKDGYENMKEIEESNGSAPITHRVGALAFYNRGLFDNGPAPLLLAFHGGGDSAMYISYISGWYDVAHNNNFLLVALENHLNSTATEMIELIDRLAEKYNIDRSRIYASGFSMGGCKSWDMYQEYPEVFAGLAPMDATFEVGLNSYGRPAPKPINRDVPVPIFYSGGEITPLPELPFQAEKCWDRMRYVFEVNKIKTPYNVTFEDRENWADKIWGISGDRVEKIYDPSRDSYLTLNYFDSEDGVCRTVFTSVSGQGHECRHHTCEQAWEFLSKFKRSVPNTRSTDAALACSLSQAARLPSI